MKRTKKGTSGSDEFSPQCDFHGSVPSSFICQGCGASICDFCNRSDRGAPLCPRCYRKELIRRFKVRRYLIFGGIGSFAVIIIGLILLALLLPGPGPEDGYLQIGHSDIIPAVNGQDPGPNNTLPIMFTLYISNPGGKSVSGGTAEILLMKAGIQWDARSESVPSISPGGMVKVVVKGFHVKEGQWTGRVSLWRGESRDQVISISFTIAGSDIEDFHSGYGEEPEPGAQPEDSANMSILTLLCLGLIGVIVLIAVLILGGAKGYARISADRILAHPTRNQLVNYLKKHPGAHFKAIARDTATPPGTLRHHLSSLQREGIVVSRSEGIFRRFYPAAGRIDPEDEEKGNRSSIMEVVEKYPGISQTDLRSILDLPKQTLSYHVLLLEEEGFLKSERKGGRKCVYPLKRHLPSS
ncbi:MAG: winged helix-turn-helix transcriptional regulator [Thermoplasmatota archaeon]